MPEPLVTPEFRLAFPQVFKPKAAKGSTREQYSIVMMFPKSADIKGMRKLLRDAVIEKFGPDTAKWPPHFRAAKFSERVSLDGKDGWPITDGDARGYDGAAGCFCVSAKANTDFKPLVVDINVQPVLDPAQVYGGLIARAQVGAWAYKHESGSTGCGFNLLKLQILRDDGTRYGGGMGGSAEDAFGPATTPAADDPANYAAPAGEEF